MVSALIAPIRRVPHRMKDNTNLTPREELPEVVRQQLAQRLGITTPIIDQAHAMLYEGKNVEEAVRDLLTRESKPEDD